MVRDMSGKKPYVDGTVPSKCPLLESIREDIERGALVVTKNPDAKWWGEGKNYQREICETRRYLDCLTFSKWFWSEVTSLNNR